MIGQVHHLLIFITENDSSSFGHRPGAFFHLLYIGSLNHLAALKQTLADIEQCEVNFHVPS